MKQNNDVVVSKTGKKRKIHYIRFNVDKMLQYENLKDFPLLKKIYDQKVSLENESTKQDLADCLYGCICSQCG